MKTGIGCGVARFCGRGPKGWRSPRKSVPTNHEPSKWSRTQNGEELSGVSVGIYVYTVYIIYIFRLFSERAGFRRSKARLSKRFARIFEDLTAYGQSRVILNALKLNNITRYKATTQIAHVFRAKAQNVHAVSRDRPRHFAHVFHEPLSTRQPRVLFSSFFFCLELLGFLKAHI